MVSGNSSSMQSSSCGGGGDEEYDSRADHSISAFLNHHMTATSINTTPPPHHHRVINVGGGGPIPDPPPPPPHHHQTHLDSFMPNYFNLDMVWSSSSKGGHPDLAGLHPTSPASHHPLPPPSQQHFFTNPHHQQPLFRPPNPIDSSPITADLIKNNNNDVSSNNINRVARNPKKRSRASRRAPTTVLTTDTTNFRAMVQEFTGIPAPPFAGSLPFPRNTRFDLSGSSSSPFPLKPFAQKLTAPLFLSSTSTSPTIVASSSSSLGYCIPSEENQNLLHTNTQSITNPILKIQAPKNPSADLSFFTSKSKILFDPSQNAKMGINGDLVEEFGHVGTNFGGFQNIVSSSTSTLVHRSENSDIENGGFDLLRTIGGNFGESLHGAASYRATDAAAEAAVVSSSAPENSLAAARNEGMVESWICSSDQMI